MDDDDSGYAITFDGDQWHTAGVRGGIAVPVPQAETIRLEYFGDVIATLTYDHASGTYTVFGFWPDGSVNVIDATWDARGWHGWQNALRWLAGLMSGGDRDAILEELERY